MCELCSVSHVVISFENNRLSQSQINWEGIHCISLQYCWIAGKMSEDKSLRGYIALYRVARSMIYKAYFIWPCVVCDPYRMSIWTVSPNLVGNFNGMVLRFDLSIVDVIPRSIIGSWSADDTEKLGILVCCSCFNMLDTLRKPKRL